MQSGQCLTISDARSECRHGKMDKGGGDLLLIPMAETRGRDYQNLEYRNGQLASALDKGKFMVTEEELMN
jgi:hypothetical protein